MKKIMQTMCVFMLLAAFVFSANSRVLKSEFKKDRMLIGFIFAHFYFIIFFNFFFSV